VFLLLPACSSFADETSQMMLWLIMTNAGRSETIRSLYSGLTLNLLAWSSSSPRRLRPAALRAMGCEFQLSHADYLPRCHEAQNDPIARSPALRELMAGGECPLGISASAAWVFRRWRCSKGETV